MRFRGSIFRKIFTNSVDCVDCVFLSISVGRNILVEKIHRKY